MRVKLKPTFQALFFVLVLMLGTTALAQTSATFNLEWNVIGSGGGESSSANYRVNGAVGQGIASQPTSGGASFTVSSGYWFGDTGTGIYLPIIFKN